MDSYQAIAHYYDLEHAEFHEDIDFYLEWIRGGPVLEVGAGTGRIMAALLRSGLHVCGVEPSSAMLARARRRIEGLPGASLCRSSIETFRSDRRFATAIISLNALWHLPTLARQIDALRVVQAHLLPGGVLLLDQSNPLTMADRHTASSVRERFQSVVDGKTIMGFSTSEHDEAAQTLALTLWYDEFEPGGAVQRTSTQLQLRYLYWAELDLALRLSGFAASAWFGSYDSEPYHAASPNLIAVAGAVAPE